MIDAQKNLDKRKSESRAHLRSLSPEEKIARLIELQEQYYGILQLRESNGGKPVPERWRKWFAARYERQAIG